jgi:putative transcriptional regulator
MSAADKDSGPGLETELDTDGGPGAAKGDEQGLHGFTLPRRHDVRPLASGVGTVDTLANHLLIAMPSLTEGPFAQTVVLVCEHSQQNALGIVLNKPLGMKLGDVMSQMKLEPTDMRIGEQPVLQGGPVSRDRGFVLHRPGGIWDSTHRVSDNVQVTTSRDVLAAIARGEGPQDAFVALGYAGWDAGQLEREMLDNAWLTLPMDEHIVFDLPFEERWQAAWQLLGVDSSRVSLTAGHA